MKKVKITVLRATFNEDLALEYGMPGLKPCSVMKQGQVFYAAHAKPGRLLRRSLAHYIPVCFRFG